MFSISGEGCRSDFAAVAVKPAQRFQTRQIPEKQAAGSVAGESPLAIRRDAQTIDRGTVHRRQGGRILRLEIQTENVLAARGQVPRMIGAISHAGDVVSLQIDFRDGSPCRQIEAAAAGVADLIGRWSFVVVEYLNILDFRNLIDLIGARGFVVAKAAVVQFKLVERLGRRSLLGEVRAGGCMVLEAVGVPIVRVISLGTSRLRDVVCGVRGCD